MNKFYTLLILISISFCAFAQPQMSVKSFAELPNDLSALNIDTERKDFNGEPCAIIKVQTTETGFSFSTGAVGVVATVQHPGEIWVYVPHSILKLTIQHPKLGVLRDYNFNIPIEKARVYELKLSTQKITQIIEQDAGGQYFVLKVLPSSAQVIIDNENAEFIQNGSYQKFLLYGTHSFTVKSHLYHDYTGTINIANERVEQQVTLQENFCILNISANVDGADVYINDELVGQTPYTSSRRKLGSYTIRITKPNYQLYQETITTTSAGTKNINANLVHNVGKVNILSKTKGAEIFINDSFKATDSWSGVLPVGTHLIELRMEGHRPSKQNVNIALGKSYDLYLDSPTPMYGKLNVNSEQNDVEILIDDIPTTTTPNIINNILAGRRKITFRKNGYLDHIEYVEILEGKIQSLDITLDPIPDQVGKIYITSNIVAASIYINGIDKGLTPLLLENIEQGICEITVKKDGYTDITRNVYVKSNETIRSHFELVAKYTSTNSLHKNSQSDYYNSIDQYISQKQEKRREQREQKQKTRSYPPESIKTTFFIDFLYSLPAQLGGRIGICKKAGWYISAYGALDAYSEESGLRILTGPMLRLADWSYFNIGIGYGRYGYDNSNSSDLYSIVDNIYNTDAHSAFEFELGLIFKIKRMSLSLGYTSNTYYMVNGGPLNIYGVPTIGVGFAF